MPEFTVRPGFFALTALFCLIPDGKSAALIAAAAFFHELGHITAAVICRRRIREISLSFTGAAIIYDDSSARYITDIAVTAAGPALNAVLCVLFARRGEYLFSGINAVYAIINLYPASFLDGGRIVRLAAIYFLGPDRGEHVSSFVDFAAHTAALAASIPVIAIYGPAPILLAPAVSFIGFYCKKADNSVKSI